MKEINVSPSSLLNTATSTSSIALVSAPSTQVADSAADSEDDSAFADNLNVTPPAKVDHRHRAKSDMVTSLFEKLINEQMSDGWESLGENQGVVISRKPDGSTTGVLKGASIIEGVKPYEVIAVATTISTRKFWDSLFDNARLVEVLNPNYRVNITYGCSKSMLTTSGRDFVMCQVMTELPNGTLYNVTCSIEDGKVPEVPGKVRGHSDVAGWCFRPHTKGTETIFLSKNDPKGWIPGAVLKMVSAQVPLCVAGVRDYLIKYGAPPFIVKLGGQVIESRFDHDTSEYQLNFKSNPSEWAPVSKIFISAKRYPAGVDITLTSPNSSAKWIFAKEILAIKSVASDRVTLKISKRSGDKFVVNFNSKIIFPLDLAKSQSKAALARSEEKKETTKASPSAFLVVPGSALVRKRHRYADIIDKLYEDFFGLIKEMEDGSPLWQQLSVYKGVTITKKVVANNPIGGYIAGESMIDGFSHEEFFAVLTNYDCKLKWDELLGSCHLLESLNSSDELSYAVMKGQFGVSPRDLVPIVGIRRLDDGTILSVGATVKDPLKPPTSAVRAECEIAGWWIHPRKDALGQPSCHVRYLSLSDPKGWIPSSVLKLLATEVALGVRGVHKFLLNQGGPPPYFDQLPGKLAQPASFDLQTSSFELNYKFDPEIPYNAIMKCSPKRYPNGADLTIRGNHTTAVLLPSSDGVAIVTEKSTPVDTLVSIRIAKRETESRVQVFTLNGKPLSSEGTKREDSGENKSSEGDTSNQEVILLKELHKNLENLRRRVVEYEVQTRSSKKSEEYGVISILASSFVSVLCGILLSNLFY